MKAQFNKPQNIILHGSMGLMMVLAIGCAKPKTNTVSDVIETTTTTTSSGVSPNTPAGDSARDSAWNEGATAALQMDSYEALNTYVGVRPINNPKDLRVSVKLQKTSANKWYGRVFISYLDNNQYYTGKFYAQNQTVQSGVSNGHTGKHHAEYNVWFTRNSKNVFHGFFEDQYGAVMLVVDDYLDLNDGAGATELSGSVWFKNYAPSSAAKNPSNLPCWFIEAGPYDCRTFMTSREIVNTTSALYPTESVFYDNYYSPLIPNEPARGWQRLGTFDGLNRAKAFVE